MRIWLIALSLCPLAVSAAQEEFRGFWLCPWEAKTEAEITSAVDAAAELGFNAVLYEVRYRGDAMYLPNKRDRRYPNPEPPSPLIRENPYPFDPLETLIAKAHARGIQVHAWVTTFVIANRKTPTPPGHAFVSHPEWLSCNRRGEVWDPYDMAWLDPGVPQVHDYLYNVFMDIVTNYDVDGLHLDYVRYTSPAFGYNASAVANFESETGTTVEDAAAFAAWRRDRITAFIARLQRGVAEVKPACAVTAAVFASRTGTAYNDCLQDWTTWLAQGYVDAVFPMAYSRDAAVVAKYIRDGASVASGRHIYAGILVPELPAGEFAKVAPDEMISKAKAAREAGADGIVVFSYGGLTKENTAVGRAIKELLFSEPASPPAMAWKRPKALQPEVTAVKVKGEVGYAVRLSRATPRRYAYLLAKEISGRASCNVSIKPAGEGWVVYAGPLPERAAAEELRTKLISWGYK